MLKPRKIGLRAASVLLPALAMLGAVPMIPSQAQEAGKSPAEKSPQMMEKSGPRELNPAVDFRTQAAQKAITEQSDQMRIERWQQEQNPPIDSAAQVAEKAATKQSLEMMAPTVLWKLLKRIKVPRQRLDIPLDLQLLERVWQEKAIQVDLRASLWAPSYAFSNAKNLARYLGARYGDMAQADAVGREVIELARERPPDDNAQMANMLVKAFVERGDSGRAVDFFKLLPPSSLRGAENRNKAVLNYNYARALEITGDRPAARSILRAIIEAGSASPLAVSRLTDLHMEAEPSNAEVAEGCAWFDELIDRGETVQAAEGLVYALESENWRTADSSGRCLLTVMHYLAEAEVGIELYTERWRNSLIRLGRLANVMGPVRALDMAYGDPERRQTTNDNEFDLESALQPWAEALPSIRGLAESYGMSGRTDRHYSQLLILAAGDQIAENRWQDALVRYYLAWDIDTENTAAAAEAANILLVYVPGTEAGNEVLSRIIDRLFVGKGEAYLGDDWPVILRFHITLGTIFMQQERWGPPENVRSAIFQWEHAIRAHREVHGERPAPGLETRLEEAYENYGTDPL